MHAIKPARSPWRISKQIMHTGALCRCLVTPMSGQVKTCPRCKSPMKLEKRRPEGATMFTGAEQWVCTNPTCGNIEDVKD